MANHDDLWRLCETNAHGLSITTDRMREVLVDLKTAEDRLTVVRRHLDSYALGERGAIPTLLSIDLAVLDGPSVPALTADRTDPTGTAAGGEGAS